MAELDTQVIVCIQLRFKGLKLIEVAAAFEVNASGVAAMLAIAQYWQEQLKQQTKDAAITLPNINLMFVATDAEEPGLYGSIALVEQLKTRMPE